MTDEIKIPVEIKLVKDPNGKTKLKATIPVGVMFIKSFDTKILEKELLKIEKRYFFLTVCLKSFLNYIRLKNERKGNVLIYWEIGNKILSFIEDCSPPLFIDNLSKSLTRDIGISESMISRCKKFRLKYPDVIQIDPEKNFNYYLNTF